MRCVVLLNMDQQGSSRAFVKCSCNVLVKRNGCGMVKLAEVFFVHDCNFSKRWNRAASDQRAHTVEHALSAGFSPQRNLMI